MIFLTIEEKELLREFQLSWAKHKYWVMARSQQDYNKIRLMAKGNEWSIEKQRSYEEILAELERLEPTDKTLRVAYQHIWGYFKKEATEAEKSNYKLLINQRILDGEGLELFLKELAVKYDKIYLTQMRWCLSSQ